jgi:anti-sigma factor RsiW
MRCRDALARSTAYVDGELDERTTRAVRGHLRGCEACAAAIADEQALRAAAADLAPVDPPPALWGAIASRLAADDVAEARRSPLALWLLGAVDALRRHALPATVAVTAAATALVWLGRGDRPFLLYRALPAPAVATAAPPAPATPSGPTPSVEDAQLGELGELVRHHEAALAELAIAVDAARPGWSTAEAARFAEAAAAARAAVVAARAELPRPGADQRLLAAYRAEIALHTRAAIGTPAALARLEPRSR